MTPARLQSLLLCIFGNQTNGVFQTNAKGRMKAHTNRKNLVTACKQVALQRPEARRHEGFFACVESVALVH